MKNTQTKAIAEDYSLYFGGRYIRRATRVVLEDGRKIELMDRCGKKDAIRQARQLIATEKRQAVVSAALQSIQQ